MSDANGGTVTVLVQGRDVNLTALLTRLEGQMRTTDAAANRAGAGLGASLGAGANRATSSMLALQQAQARLEAQQGNLVGAADRLRNALGQVSTTTTQTIGASRQLIAIEAQQAAAAERAGRAVLQEAVSLARLQSASGNTAGAIRTLTQAQGQLQAGSASFNNLGASIAKLQTGTTVAQQFGGALKSNLLSILGPAAAAGAALGALASVARQTQEAFEFKAQFDATTASINSQLGRVRDMSIVWAEANATAKTYRITQSETNAILSSSIDVLRTSSASVGDLEIALLRLQSRDPSKPISEAARALRELNAGDVTTIKELFNVSAGDAGRMKREIEGGADAVQVLTGFLDSAGSGMDILAQRTEGATGKMLQLRQESERLKLTLGEGATGPGLAILNSQIIGTQTLTADLRGDFNALAEANQAFASTLVQTGDFEAAMAARTAVLDAALQAATASTQTQAAAQVQLTATGQPLVSGMQAQIDAALAAGQASREHTAELQASSEAAQLDAAQKAANAAQTALMTAETQAAVGAFLALNPNLSASGAAAAASAAGYSPLIAKLIELAVQARETRAEMNAVNALAGVKALRAPGSAGGGATGEDEIRADRRRSVVEDRNVRVAAGTAAADAEARYQQQLGNTTPLLARRRNELAQLRQGSAAYFDKLAEINQLETQAAKSPRGAGGGGGGGSVKLSDQTKLNNSLLAGQEKYQDQAEQAERQHQDKILDIQRDAAKRQLEQQKQNEVSKRESELGFLESITASELNATQEGRDAIAAINARYYADFEKAQQAAQAGNAAQSEAMVKAAGERAAAEQRYAEQIDKARQDENASEVARLEALREKQRQILDEKEKQIAEGGDKNVNATNEALAQEQQRYEEQQGKAGTAAEQAAERKVNAALRSGKAVSDETALLLEQETILNRMGRTAAPVGVGAPSTPGAAAASTPAPTADPNAGILGGLEGIINAVNAMKDTLSRSQDNTTNAVRGLGSRLSQA